MSVSKNSQHAILPIASHDSVRGSESVGTPPLPANSIRHEYTVFIGEFIGTFLFLFIAFAGTQVAVVSSTIDGQMPGGDTSLDSIQQVSKLIYVSFAFGAGLAVNVAIFADISGGMFNPAVSIQHPSV